LEHHRRYLEPAGPPFSGVGHTNMYYDEVLRVPLIMRHPGFKTENRRIEAMVELIDVMPTVLDFLGIRSPESAQGISLVPLIKGQSASAHKYVFSEIGYGFLSVRTKEWKLICMGKECELYDLLHDPAELNNLNLEKEEVVRRLFGVLMAWHNHNKYWHDHH
jgi:choline-sulfatase